jgi:ATP-dependent DNA helicase RecQ
MLDNAKILLKKYYGYDSFREGQEKVISSILEGKDTFAIMPTGAGKSICYQIPALLMKGITIVISPLISLMKDQVDALSDIGINATFINSSLDQYEVQERLLMAVSGHTKLLYVAPERLESESFCALLKTLDISMIAIDECHCVSQWGHDFRPSYRSIAPLIDRLVDRPVVSAFTATATSDVKEDVVRLLGLKRSNVYTTGFDRENLFFSVIRGENKKDYLLKYLENNKDQVGIIYAGTRKEVDNIHETLAKKGYSIGKYHAGMNDQDRSKAQEDFLYDNVNIIVATNAFGMGIDKSNVRYVIHYTIPKNMEAYYQEAGRAGRDGENSECILLFGAQDIILQKFLIEQNVYSEERRINDYRRLQDVVDYCHTTKCLRKFILEYFGETNVTDACGNCSVCKDETELTDITIDAQKIFSCIARMKQKFGTVLVAQVLRGSKDKRVLEFGFNKLSTYSIMKNYTVKEIQDLINVLIADEYLYLTESQFPLVKLKEKSLKVLKGEEMVFHKIHKAKKKVTVENSLFSLLKAVRKDVSERESVPPYIIFTDAALREMSEKLPQNEIEFLNIKGVGESKLRKYGVEFLKAIKAYSAEKPSEESEKEAGNDIPSHVITLDMCRGGRTVEGIAAERNLKTLTVEEHLMRCAQEGMDVDLDILIPKEHERAIFEAITKSGCTKLKEMKEMLPQDVSYTAIKAAMFKVGSMEN